MFTKGVAICTGSGIGAVGSTCIQHDDWYLIWIGADLEKTYGKDLMNLITRKIEPHRLLIWDTKGSLGRPDVNVELARVFKLWNAQGKQAFHDHSLPTHPKNKRETCQGYLLMIDLSCSCSSFQLLCSLAVRHLIKAS